MHVVEIGVIPHVTPGFVTINDGRAPLGAPIHVTLTQPSHSFAECIYTDCK
jgi:hypothetical protein